MTVDDTGRHARDVVRGMRAILRKSPAGTVLDVATGVIEGTTPRGA